MPEGSRRNLDRRVPERSPHPDPRLVTTDWMNDVTSFCPGDVADPGGERSESRRRRIVERGDDDEVGPGVVLQHRGERLFVRHDRRRRLFDVEVERAVRRDARAPPQASPLRIAGQPGHGRARGSQPPHGRGRLFRRERTSTRCRVGGARRASTLRSRRSRPSSGRPSGRGRRRAHRLSSRGRRARCRSRRSRGRGRSRRASTTVPRTPRPGGRRRSPGARATDSLTPAFYRLP